MNTQVIDQKTETLRSKIHGNHKTFEPAKEPYAIKEEINALHNEFQRYGQNAKEWLRQCQLMLPEIKEKEVWKHKEFSSIYEYAAKLAGMNRNSVDDALRILERIEGMPALKHVAAQRGINAIRPIITIATAQTEEFWAHKAQTMSKTRLKPMYRRIKEKILLKKRAVLVRVRVLKIKGAICQMLIMRNILRLLYT